MKELRPFGDVPAKLTAQLKRSFVATRTFSQALIISSSVVNNMQKVYLIFLKISLFMFHSQNVSVIKKYHI